MTVDDYRGARVAVSLENWALFGSFATLGDGCYHTINCNARDSARPLSSKYYAHEVPAHATKKRPDPVPATSRLHPRQCRHGLLSSDGIGFSWRLHEWLRVAVERLAASRQEL